MLRRTTSLVSLLSLILLAATSIVLYFEPEGRVAYWADWHFLGLDKHQWGDTHLTLGTLFLVSSIVHIWLNWGPITTYMKNRAKDLIVVTPPMVFAAIITLAVFLGTLLHLPPMQQVVDLSAYFKDNMAEKYGNPPYGHAELSTVEKFCGHMGMDAGEALENLHKAGLATASLDKSLKEIGDEAGITPSEVFALMRGSGGDKAASTGLPPNPPPGVGKQSLKSLCEQYGLPLATALERLGQGGIAADPDKTIKDMATESGKQPVDVYRILQADPKGN